MATGFKLFHNPRYLTISEEVNFDLNVYFYVDLMSYSFLFILLSFFLVVCSALSAQGSAAAQSGDQAGVTTGLASGEGLQSLHNDDDELETEEMISGGDDENVSFHGENNF